jgi:hypothetical protein
MNIHSTSIASGFEMKDLLHPVWEILQLGGLSVLPLVLQIGKLSHGAVTCHTVCLLQSRELAWTSDSEKLFTRPSYALGISTDSNVSMLKGWY